MKESACFRRGGFNIKVGPFIDEWEGRLTFGKRFGLPKAVDRTELVELLIEAAEGGGVGGFVQALNSIACHPDRDLILDAIKDDPLELPQ